jgi:hypothetical protein
VTCATRPAPPPTQPTIDKWNCNVPPPTVFTSVNVTADVSAAYSSLASGKIGASIDPRLISLLSQAVQDQQITSYLRCLAINRDHYTNDQALYLEVFNDFIATKPTAAEVIAFRSSTPFPSSTPSTSVVAGSGTTLTFRRRTVLLDSLPDEARVSAPDGALDSFLEGRGNLVLDNAILVIAPATEPPTTVSLAAYSISLLNGSRVVTNGHALVMTARILNAASGDVVAFVADSLTPPPALLGQTAPNGRDAGSVVVQGVTDIKGTLVVGLGGQDGAQGAPGSAGQQGTVGARGDNAADGFLSCARGGGNGAIGGQGTPGGTGGRGGNAGNGGTLTVRQSPGLLPASLRFSAEPGRSGAGGPGGQGGPGGPGGDGGSGSAFCAGGHPGPPGPAGPTGVAGARGTSGNPGTVLWE